MASEQGRCTKGPRPPIFLEGLVSARTCGFKSPLRHQQEPTHEGGLRQVHSPCSWVLLATDRSWGHGGAPASGARTNDRDAGEDRRTLGREQELTGSELASQPPIRPHRGARR